MPTLKTKDLWQSAFLLAKGANLLDVVPHARGAGRTEVMFVFESGEVHDHLREFKSGQAVCNVTSLKASMCHLKEEMFRVIRG